MTARRVYAVVGALAVVAYVSALRNRFAWDDTFLIAGSALVRSKPGWWRAFGNPYWPAELGGYLYRPLTVASYVVDWHVDGAAWFHAVNILWHAAASLLVARLLMRWSGERAALLGGVLFAVHPVHVEAVANVVGRAELMATAFTLLAVYIALEREQVGWSCLCWVLGLLSKENAAVAPALIAAAWAVGLRRPSRQRMGQFALAWLAAGAGYGTVRELVLRSYTGFAVLAPVFMGQPPRVVRLTALAAVGDVARLLLAPLTLRVDYGPNERTAVVTLFDIRAIAGLLCLLLWGLLLGLAVRRGRKVEALGLAWIALAYGPVANVLFPTGVLVAERTLYLPSAGLALAVGALGGELRPRALALVVGAVALLGGVRTALRVPVWQSNLSVTLSILDDSPSSYVGPMATAPIYFEARQPAKALAAARVAASIFPLDARPFLMEARAALELHRTAFADSLLGRVDRLCSPCQGLYGAEAAAARRLGDTAAADALLDHARALGKP